jgi:hypothetical protein
MQLIQMAQPKNVMLVHGEAKKMAALKQRIQTELNIPCFDPGNGQTITIKTEDVMPIAVSSAAMERLSNKSDYSGNNHRRPFLGILQQDPQMNRLRFYDQIEAREELGLSPVTVRRRLRKTFDISKLNAASGFSVSNDENRDPRYRALVILSKAIERFAQLTGVSCFLLEEGIIKVDSVSIYLASAPGDCAVYLEWPRGSEEIATRIFLLLGATLRE